MNNRVASSIANIETLTPQSNSPLLRNLRLVNEQLTDGTLNNESTADLENMLQAAERLAYNLKLAKQAAEFAVSKLSPTNRPHLHGKHVMLEKTRKKLNDTELVKQFTALKEQRDKLAQQSNTPSTAEFVQDAYRKSTGINIRMWYGHAMEKADQTKLGNCSEQANVAFGYLYTLAYEDALTEKTPDFNLLERIDVDNFQGGHSFLLLDRNKLTTTLEPKKQYAMDVFMNETKNFGDTCVVIDPWNKDHPYYPASDIPSNMPPCGMSGRVNIEFGLDFSTQAPVITRRISL